jgi:dolichol-phosphate mannosyltransferase
LSRTGSIVVPLYNEQDSILTFHARLSQVIAELDYRIEITYVDDGSTDGTLARLNEVVAQNMNVVVLSLSRNFGHQAALTAGLQHSTGDFVITMDGDGEHPPELLPRMVALYESGYDLVLMQREETPQLGLFKRITSDLFYQIINWIGEGKILPGAADFRLMSRHVVECLNRMPERHRFLRGMVSWMGFNVAILPFAPGTRLAGKPRYNLSRMIRLAQDAIFSFSTAPLRLALLAGAVVFLLALAQLVYVVIVVTTRGLTSLVPGWTSLMLGILLIGGVQLVMLGLQGYYIGMIFQEVKQRPIYLLRERPVPPPEITESEGRNNSANS